MKRKTKHLLELDPHVLLTALQNEKQRIVEYVRLEIQDSLDSLKTTNTNKVLPSMADHIINVNMVLGKLDNAIAELKEQTGMDDTFLERSIITDFVPDDIPF